MKIKRVHLLLMSIIFYLLGILYGQSRMLKKVEKTQKNRATTRSNAPLNTGGFFK